MKDYFEASRKVASEITRLKVLSRSIPERMTTLGESFAAQLVADGAKLVGTWVEIPDNEAYSVRRYYHVTCIERCPIIPWIDEAARNSSRNLRRDCVLVFEDGAVCVIKGKCISDFSLKGEERKHRVDVFELLHSRQASPEEVENLLSKKEAWLKNAHVNNRKFEETSKAANPNTKQGENNEKAN